LNTLDLDPVSTIDPNFFSMTLNPTTPPVWLWRTTNTCMIVVVC
jgi:hypothetical protein